MSRHRALATAPGEGPPGSAGPAGGAVVEAVGVGVDVPGRPGVLQDVSVTVRPGELVVVAGRSGSGKSTFCHLVAGVGRPDRGVVRVLGRPAHEWADWSRVTLLPQRLALVPELSVRENVAWPSLLAGAADGPLLLLEVLGLDHIADELAVRSSLGEQQRTGLARALATRPALAVLDEPTGHQDDANVARVLAALHDRDPRTAVLVATHDERVREVADRVVHLEGGRVVRGPGAPGAVPGRPDGR